MKVKARWIQPGFYGWYLVDTETERVLGKVLATGCSFAAYGRGNEYMTAEAAKREVERCVDAGVELEVES